jgi:hypothetical protein
MSMSISNFDSKQSTTIVFMYNFSM